MFVVNHLNARQPGHQPGQQGVQGQREIHPTGPPGQDSPDHPKRKPQVVQFLAPTRRAIAQRLLLDIGTRRKPQGGGAIRAGAQEQDLPAGFGKDAGTMLQRRIAGWIGVLNVEDASAQPLYVRLKSNENQTPFPRVVLFGRIADPCGRDSTRAFHFRRQSAAGAGAPRHGGVGGGTCFARGHGNAPPRRQCGGRRGRRGPGAGRDASHRRQPGRRRIHVDPLQRRPRHLH